MLGQRIAPLGYHPLADNLSGAELAEFVDGMKTLMDRCVAAMPTHADFIARHCAAAKS